MATDGTSGDANGPDVPISEAPIGETRDRLRRLRVVGMGSGGLDQITVEGVAALRASGYALAAMKGPADPLVDLRKRLLARHAPGLELVGVTDPERDRSSSSTSSQAGYRGVVLDWHEARSLAWERVLADRPGDVAVPVWGDPAFYDSTLRIVDRILARGRLDLDVEVIPGISALQVLAARHRLVLHEIGGTVTVTTGRRLAEVVAGGADNVVVMLNADLPLDHLADWHIWWGGNLGDRGECLVSGRVGEVLAELRHARERLRAEHGWVMDVYLLRRQR
ncbi:precorrin 6A synthase [Dietzia sp. UCD-THP]|uniref:precorrin-6A synthase (deacetylating) n=1 Tax=Dietzia sp. UCD-THP TaxID=1292020 RepID=UPI0003755396|nr:precorrin-6A synthase (deacetylating) [Dietzia sp. UCD-THP]EYT61974.1 precorrin 6A synthase [Dietzia sp. UCD-THP]